VPKQRSRRSGRIGIVQVIFAIILIIGLICGHEVQQARRMRWPAGLARGRVLLWFGFQPSRMT
jgi:hypothetical protein